MKTMCNGRPYIIREARADDAEQLLAFGKRIAEEPTVLTMPDEFTWTLEGERKWIQGLLDNPNETIVVACCGQEIIGVIDAHGVKRRKRRHTCTLGMSVKREYRDQGVGAELLRAVLDWARRNPEIEKVSLAVMANNPRAIHLYQRMGFREEGRLIRENKQPDGAYVDDIIMARFVK